MEPVRRVINGDPFLLVPEFARAEPLGSEWEAPLYAAFKEALRPGLTVLDVGASFGLYAIAAARLGAAAGRVVALEPARASAAALGLHLEWNGVADLVEVVEAAAAERDGEEPFWEQETSFVASLVESAARQEGASFATPVSASRVPAVTLDGLCARRGLDPDVVKIDAEGGEARVLRGGRALLARRRAVVFLELHHDVVAEAGGSAGDVFRELERAGWRWREVATEAAAGHYVCTPAG